MPWKSSDAKRPTKIDKPTLSEPEKEKEFVLFQLAPDQQVQAEVLKHHPGEQRQADLRVHINLSEDPNGLPYKDFLRVRQTDAQPHRMLPGTWQPIPQPEPVEEGV